MKPVTWITAREWRITAGPAQQNTVLSTTASVSWTPTTIGTYTLQYSATNSFGTGSDTMTVSVTAGGGGGGGGGTGSPIAFVGVGVAATGAQSNVAVPAPVGVASGNFQICIIQCAGEETMSTVPPDWILMGELSPTSASGDPGGPAHSLGLLQHHGFTGGHMDQERRAVLPRVRLAWSQPDPARPGCVRGGCSSASHQTPRSPRPVELCCGWHNLHRLP